MAEFAYAEPLRPALQQITWGRPSPLEAPDQRGVALGITASAGGHDLSQRLAKIETAIFRHKTITFEYYTMERDETQARKVDPYHLLYQGGQFYLLGRAHERNAVRVFRLSRIRGKVAYATKAEHGTSVVPATSIHARGVRTAPSGSSATRLGSPRSCIAQGASPGCWSATSAALAEIVEIRGQRRSPLPNPLAAAQRASIVSWVLGLRRAHASLLWGGGGGGGGGAGGGGGGATRRSSSRSLGVASRC